MKRLIAAPWLSLALWAMWLLLNRSVAPGHVILGALLAIALPRWLAPLRPAVGPLRHGPTLVRLVLHVAGDVVRSTLDVGLGVFRAARRPPRARFVVVPLDLRDAQALAALSMITAVIPGTVWSELAPDRSRLLLHVFDLDDEDPFVARFKARYEQPLKEIFE
jgi:multicomponent K+:H+ antiporter subunit E